MKEELLRISTIVEQVCEKTTEDYKEINPNVKFCLYRNERNNEVLPFSAYDIAKFYNKNWTGNLDFMHIPNYHKVLEYIKNYPIIVAYDKENKDILGISTLKYDEITDTHIDPYFPEPGARYFSMTGVLTNPNNSKKGLRGIGNKLYEIELFSALCYKQCAGCDDVRIVCVIDCRNKNSIYAIKKAADNLGKEFNLGRLNMEFPASIVACYYITDKNKTMTEAPTLVIEVGLDPKRIVQSSPRNLEFKPDKNLNESLLKTVFQTFTIDKNKEISINKDMELGGVDVTYVRFDQETNQLKNFPTIITNDTEKGNDRVPLSELEMMSQVLEDNERINVEKESVKKKVMHLALA